MIHFFPRMLDLTEERPIHHHHTLILVFYTYSVSFSVLCYTAT